MSDQSAFEARLASAYAQLMADAPRLENARAVASAAVADAGKRRGVRWSSPLAGRRYVMSFAAAGLIVALVGGALFVGSQLNETPRPTAPPAPTAPVIATATPGPTATVVPEPTNTPHAGPRDYLDEFAAGAPLSMAMAHPLLVPLLDDRVLVLGENIAEVYDAEGGSQSRIGSLIDSGVFSATRAADGRVLVIGLAPGVGNANEGLITQVFDPQTDTFSAAGPMVTARQDSVTVALADGRILIAGGVESIDGPDIPLLAPELFDPTTSTFVAAGFESGLTSIGHMTLLSDGRVLISGGQNEQFPHHTTAPNGNPAAEVYDPATGSVAPTGAPLHRPRFVIPTVDGGALAVWDTGDEFGLDAWDSASDKFRTVGTMPVEFTQVVGLEDGRLLATRDYDTVLIDPSGAVTTLTPRTAWNPSVVVLADGRVMIAGGTVDGVFHPSPPGNIGPPPGVETVVIFH